jgi:hypothetical protein
VSFAWLKTILVTSAALAALAGACFTVQAAILGRPAFAKLELVRALQDVRTTGAGPIAVQVVGDGFGAACSEAPAAHSRVSCKKLLVRWLSRQLIRGAVVESRAADLGSLRGYDLRLPWTDPHVQLFVEPSGRPLLAVALGSEAER